MRLPEYDNSPPPGTPLYDPAPRPVLEDEKFVLLGFGLPTLILGCVGLFVVGFIALFN